jgi:glutathione S-transferase
LILTTLNKQKDNTMNTIKLHGFPLSGHSHRAELFASVLGLNIEVIEVALKQGAHKQPEFLAKNIFGQVPVLEIDGRFINDSNGILVYLAGKFDSTTQWYPNDAVIQAEIQRWLSVAAGAVAFGPAAARLVNVFGAGLDHENAKQTAYRLFDTMDQHLAQRDWLVGDSATIADIANFTYIEHAPEGDVSLENYPNIKKWLDNVRSLKGFVPMQVTHVGLRA